MIRILMAVAVMILITSGRSRGDTEPVVEETSTVYVITWQEAVEFNNRELRSIADVIEKLCAHIDDLKARVAELEKADKKGLLVSKNICPYNNVPCAFCDPLE